MRLKRVVDGKHEYQRLLRKVEELETMATKMTPSLTGMPKNANLSRAQDDTWAVLIDYKTKCEKQLGEYLRDCKQLEEELNCIKSPKIRAVMKYRYVDGMRIWQIADLMGNEMRWIQTLLRKGERIYKEMYGDG